MRLTLNALKVSSGELVSFDSQKQAIGIEHIMASGALPPGFPPVRIDGDLYWGGGLYSNTPIETIFDDTPPVDTLCFMVDLWRAEGPEPTNLNEVQTRQKDIIFASRSNRHIEAYRRTHNLRCMLDQCDRDEARCFLFSWFLGGLVSFRYVLKPVLIILFVLTSLAFYFTNQYGALIDKGMMQNVFERDVREATELFSYSLLASFILLGLIPSAIVLKLKIDYGRYPGTVIWKIVIVACSAMLLPSIIARAA